MSESSATGQRGAAQVIQHRRRQLERAAKRIRRSAKPRDFHDARVATRRLRSALRILEAHDERARRRAAELRRVGRRLGRARDYDVVLARLDSLVASQGLASSKDVAAFRKDLLESRTRARRRVVEMLEGKRFCRLTRKLRRFEPKTDDWGCVEAQVRARAAALGKIDVDPLTAGDEELHRYRIRTKRLRYTLELAAARSEPVHRLLAAATDVQDRLGTLHDAVVVESLVNAFAGAHRHYRDSNDLAQLAAACRDEQQRLREGLVGTLTEFRRELAQLLSERVTTAP